MHRDGRAAIRGGEGDVVDVAVGKQAVRAGAVEDLEARIIGRKDDAEANRRQLGRVANLEERLLVPAVQRAGEADAVTAHRQRACLDLYLVERDVGRADLEARA